MALCADCFVVPLLPAGGQQRGEALRRVPPHDDPRLQRLSGYGGNALPHPAGASAPTAGTIGGRHAPAAAATGRGHQV